MSDTPNIPSRANWFVGCNCSSIFDDKSAMIQRYMKMLFERTTMMFEYDGLPDTIPKFDYQIIKQTFGSVTITDKFNGKPYAYYGALGGELNEYYHPTISIVTNPYQKFNATLKIGEDCVVIKNDLFYQGLYKLNQLYAELLTECDISIRKCLMNIRVDNVVTSSTDSDDTSIKAFFKAVENGKFAHITTKKFMDETLLQIHEVASKSSNPLKDLIEMRNYIDSSWYIEIGLNANYNMKRETLTDAETNVDDKTLIPLIQQMLECEKDGWDAVNKKYNLNVKVRLSDVWNKMYKEVIEEPKQEEASEDADKLEDDNKSADESEVVEDDKKNETA